MNPETPSFNQLSQQVDAGHKKMTVLVERSGDKISTGHYKGEKLSNGQYVVEVTAANGETGYRQVSGDALSDTAQAALAESLAADRMAAPEDSEAAPEQLASTERVRDLQTHSERLVRDNTPLVEGMMQGERQLMGAVHQGQDIIKHFTYGNIEKPQAVSRLRETIDQVSQLVRHQGEAVDSHLMQEARTFVAEAEEAVAAVSRDAQEHDIDDDVRLIVRKTESAAEEIRSAVKVMDVTGDERGQALRRLAQLLEELERDSWGSETTAAQLGKAFSDIENATGAHMRSLGYIEAEMDTLRRLQNVQ